jgi:hypothetical protein
MKPHRLADLANALTAVAAQYGQQEQCRERILSILLEHFAPEHDNRGPELETAVLVDARELEALRKDREECLGSIDAFLSEASRWIERDGSMFDGDLCEIADRRLRYTLDALRSTAGGA